MNEMTRYLISIKRQWLNSLKFFFRKFRIQRFSITHSGPRSIAALTILLLFDRTFIVFSLLFFLLSANNDCYCITRRALHFSSNILSKTSRTHPDQITTNLSKGKVNKLKTFWFRKLHFQLKEHWALRRFPFEFDKRNGNIWNHKFF